ncbi:hypothetical protein VB780_00625 [Leptolyngbya sp. CCNP1308]|uniref:hypothetical protein n=1 Tax=Leptolyngbya sp. CCNP1308 TaxID=3110255 RepID=UPI002B202DBD|nr:hypothetical protein [Leptolyngbya sp. CCNP1308]MEA5447054.1 hypothetical protein [Leptolyngbya sp. CCNP1308]
MQADDLFRILKSVALPELPSLVETQVQDFLPKQSKSLTTNLIKDVVAVSEPRLLVITGHLYFDYILGRIIQEESIELSKKEFESFSRKLNAIHKKGALDTNFFESLQAINGLRNKFSHDIFFDISSWDPSCIPYVGKHDLRIPRRKYLLRAFNIVVVRLTFFTLALEMPEQKRWLFLEDIPKKP